MCKYIKRSFHKIPNLNVKETRSYLHYTFAYLVSKILSLQLLWTGSCISSCSIVILDQVRILIFNSFSAYYLNNILPSYGNLIFLLAQIFEGVGILLGWLILVKLGEKITTGNTLIINRKRTKLKNWKLKMPILMLWWYQLAHACVHRRCILAHILPTTNFFHAFKWRKTSFYIFNIIKNRKWFNDNFSDHHHPENNSK